MPTTTRLGVYIPFGTFKSATNAAGTTTTFHTTNANAASMNIGDMVKVYALASGLHTVRGGEVTITNKQVDTPSAGTTRFTFTPALGSASQTGDEVYDPEVMDVTTWISNNHTKADGILGAFPCTSSTRPTGSSRFTDMVIHEKDTHNLLRWTGASWESFANPIRARGRMAYTSSNAAGSSTAPGSQTGPYLTSTFNAKAGQWYKVFVSVNENYASGAGGGEAWLVLRKATGGSVSGSDTEISRCSGDIPTITNTSDTWNNRSIGAFQVSSDQQVTVGLFLDRTGMSDAQNMQFSANCFNIMCVEDMGQ